MTFWRALADHLETGEVAVLGIVADHTRHSPGTRGAKMFVRPDGSQFGTIGGGGMEATFLDRAFELRGQTTQVLHHREDTDSLRSGLICAGKQTMVYLVAAASDAPTYRQFADAVDDDQAMELVIEAGKPRIAPRPVGVAAPITFRDDVYTEHAVNHQRIAIVGGGHCGFALSRTMRHLGYRVQLFDERDDVFTFIDNDYAHEKVVVADYADAGGLVLYPELTHFVVMTADVASDVRGLLGGIERPFPYKGVMGSAAKLLRIRDMLRDAGVKRARFEELYAPVGLEMTSNTPAEIAVSIAAQILRERESLFPWSRPSPA